jgi:murein DD-endopeptidase MepM/ murein hydrolase activator NlpD
MKLHRGTDFAAPTGTAIYAAGDATVEWAAMKGANGNLTILLHDNGWETYYLHQSRFMPGVVRGARVRQGQEIGEVGTTGRSTGPHLHYEVHVDHQPVNPLSLDYGSGRSLAGGALAAFVKERDRIDAARAGAAD